MIVNTTFIFRAEDRERVIDWLRTLYCTAAVCSGTLSAPQLREVTFPTPEDGTVSLALQLFTADIEAAIRWENSQGEALRRRLASQLGAQNFVWFTSILKEIEI